MEEKLKIKNLRGIAEYMLKIYAPSLQIAMIQVQKHPIMFVLWQTSICAVIYDETVGYCYAVIVLWIQNNIFYQSKV